MPLACIHCALRAQAFLISLLLGVLLAYTLNPPVAWLQRIRIPRIAASLIVLVGAMGVFALGAYSIRGQMQAVVTQLPEATSEFAAGLSRLRTSQSGSLPKMQSVSTAVEKATSQLTGPPPVAGQRDARVVIDQSGFKLGDSVIAVAAGMAAFVQFDSFPMALLVCGVSLTIATLIGTFVTTWLTGRISRLNPAVFISRLFWGWLWGICGMLRAFRFSSS